MRNLISVVAIAGFLIAGSASAQTTATQDAKKAGSAAKGAVVDTGSAVTHGTKAAAKGTAHGVTKVAKGTGKAATATGNAAKHVGKKTVDVVTPGK